MSNRGLVPFSTIRKATIFPILLTSYNKIISAESPYESSISAVSIIWIRMLVFGIVKHLTVNGILIG